MYIYFLSRVILQENLINEVLFAFHCASEGAISWIATSFAYKGLLQLCAIFMAFTTRKVNVRGLNASKEIYAMIYINSVILTALIAIEFTVKSYSITFVALFSLAVFTEASLFLGMTFVPQVYIHTDSTTLIPWSFSVPSFLYTQQHSIILVYHVQMHVGHDIALIPV